MKIQVKSNVKINFYFMAVDVDLSLLDVGNGDLQAFQLRKRL